MSRLSATILFFLCSLLAGCGQKGPLTLPADATPPASATAGQPARQGSKQDQKDDDRDEDPVQPPRP